MARQTAFFLMLSTIALGDAFSLAPKLRLHWHRSTIQVHTAFGLRGLCAVSREKMSSRRAFVDAMTTALATTFFAR